jgi:hypothetical protein
MDEGAFRSLTVFVAVSEHALSELRKLAERPDDLIAQIERSRDAALQLAEAAADAERTGRRNVA